MCSFDAGRGVASCGKARVLKERAWEQVIQTGLLSAVPEVIKVQVIVKWSLRRWC